MKKKSATKPRAKHAIKTSRSDNSRALAVNLQLDMKDTAPPTTSWLPRQLRKAAALANTYGELNIVIVGDKKMAALHVQYKNVPGTTDVLTFDLSGSPRHRPGDAIMGDLVLCKDEAARQAKTRGHSTRIELLLYAIHGMLHLSGYDDITAAKAARMHKREDELLTALGIGAVFDK